MFPTRSNPTSPIAPPPDEPVAGPSRPPVQPRQHAADYAARRLGIGKDEYIRWSVGQVLQRGLPAASGAPIAPMDIAATEATLAAFAARSWDELAAPYIQEWSAAPDAHQAISQGDSSSSPPPQPGAASQQARLRDDWAARQNVLPRSFSPMDEDHVSAGTDTLDRSGPTSKGKEPAIASSDEESLPSSPRSIASSARPDSRIPPSRQNSVDDLIALTIQTAQRKRFGKTTGWALNNLTKGIDELNAKAERSAIPVEATAELYRKRAGKRSEYPKELAGSIPLAKRRQQAASQAASGDESLPASPRSSASGPLPDTRIPPSRQNSVDGLITQTIQAAQKKKTRKTAPWSLKRLEKGANALNAKAGRSLIPVGTVVGLYRQRAGKPGELPKDALDPDTQEPISKHALAQREARRRRRAAQASAESGPATRPGFICHGPQDAVDPAPPVHSHRPPGPGAGPPQGGVPAPLGGCRVAAGGPPFGARVSA